MDMFTAIAEPTRRHILEMLASRGQLSASVISHKFPVSQPAISQHLKILREAKLVDMEKRAQQRLYRVNPRTMLELERWAEYMKKLWSGRFDRLEEVLKYGK
jgi:DNA-binding transcriptional ArsR family regulator